MSSSWYLVQELGTVFSTRSQEPENSWFSEHLNRNTQLEVVTPSFQSFRVRRDAHLGGAFDVQLQHCLALLQQEAPDGLDLLELREAGGLWRRMGRWASDPLTPEIRPWKLLSMGEKGCTRKSGSWEYLRRTKRESKTIKTRRIL